MLPSPLIQEIPYIEPQKAFNPLAGEPFAILLDSAQVDTRQGRTSYIACDPFLTLESKNGDIRLGSQRIQGNPFLVLQTHLNEYVLSEAADLPPFQGGAAGYFGYDLAQHLEVVPLAEDDMEFPDMAIGFYDVVAAFDNIARRAWVFSSGFPEKDTAKQMERAQERAAWLAALFEQQPVAEMRTGGIDLQVQPNFTPQGYQDAVKKVIDYIFAGDIFQANLSQRFRGVLPDEFDAYSIYQDLRKANPAPFGAYLNYGETIILSSSPERFLKLSAGQVETRPIKGTIQRHAEPETDRQMAEELRLSEKNRAENIMIVDLLRNDLSRVCKPFTVKTPELCVVESYENLHHLVSTVTGELREGMDAIDLLCASFPGGSITGAPKVRAMEIIAELEPTRRGPYCGSIGFIGFNGNMDTNIAIRTISIKGNELTFQVGGGIVADSDPAEEYEETLTKAKAIFNALGAEQNKREPFQL